MRIPLFIRLPTRSSPEVQAIYTYQPATGRLATVSGNASGTFTYTYLANSNLIETITKGALNPSPEFRTVNAYEPTRDVLLTKINSTVNGNSVTEASGIGYTVNDIGQRTHAMRSGASTTESTWGYDSLGQVISADASDNAQDRAYQYDTIGNRQKSANSLTLPETNNYAANALNQYTAIPQAPAAPVFDDDGNMTGGPLQSGAGILPAALTWDAENRLIQTQPGNNSPAGPTLYLYDSQSRRIAKTTNGQTTVFVYDGWNVIAEYQLQNSTFILHHSYLWGLDLSGSMQGAGGVGGLLCESQISNSQISNFYPTFDGNGNVTEYLDSTGAVVAHFEYDPFGNTVVNTDSGNLFNYRFSTKPLDSEIGLYYYGYRYYDPLTGRWPSRDPIGEKGGKNLYGFVGNDGVNLIDILGLAFSDGSPDGADYTAAGGDGITFLDGNGSYTYIVNPKLAVLGSLKTKLAAETHEKYHVKWFADSPQHNALPYKQLFCLKKNGETNPKYYYYSAETGTLLRTPWENRGGSTDIITTKRSLLWTRGTEINYMTLGEAAEAGGIFISVKSLKYQRAG